MATPFKILTFGPTAAAVLTAKKILIAKQQEVAAAAATAAAAAAAAASNEKGSHKNKIIDDPSSRMGVQSQNRQGSVSKCRSRGKKPTKYKDGKDLVQMGVDGGPAFVAHRDCVVCKSIHLKTWVAVSPSLTKPMMSVVSSVSKLKVCLQ
jgi:hypothetical protein